jgi:hypothetical protein
MNKAFLNPKKFAEMHSKGVVGSYAANMRGLFKTFLNYMGVIFWAPESKGKFQ